MSIETIDTGLFLQELGFEPVNISDLGFKLIARNMQHLPLKFIQVAVDDVYFTVAADEQGLVWVKTGTVRGLLKDHFFSKHFQEVDRRLRIPQSNRKKTGHA